MSTGVLFDTDRLVWISEGGSGKVRLVDWKSGNHEKIVDLNQGQWRNSFTGDLALDSNRRLLYVIDRTNRRVAVVDAKKGQILASVVAGRSVIAIGLSPDRNTAYVTSAGGHAGVIDVRIPAEPALQGWIGGEDDSHLAENAAADSCVLAVGDRVYVSNAREDSISVIAARERRVVAEIPLRIHSLETFRGIRPGGLAFDPLTKWLLVAEAGINAVGVIDTASNSLKGHIPVGWDPKRIAISGDRVYVTNSRGRGTGPHLRHPILDLGETPSLHRGSVSTFVMPSDGDLAKLTRTVYAANGFNPEVENGHQPEAPENLKYAVLILKGDCSFDEMLGDVREANNPLNRRVQAVPQLARFGMRGLADGRRRQLSVKDVAITPNQHALAQRWAFGDNFYTAPQESGLAELWDHLDRHGVKYRKFGDDEETLPDQVRADRFITEAEKLKGALPPFLFIRLPNDGVEVRQADREGYPYQASYVADNDLAVGRIVQYLSHTPEWREMAVFITEETAEGGLDHIDSHRTVLLAAGPWIRQNYVTHTNSDSAGLLKTIFALLRVPPFDLRVATARGLFDIFSVEPEYAPFEALPADNRIFGTER